MKCIGAVLSCAAAAAAADSQLNAATHTAHGDRIRVTVPLASTCDVTQYGAKGDGKTDDTKAIQAAINACGSNSRVTFPGPRTFLTFPLTVPGNLNNFIFEVQPTARVLFSNDKASWPGQQDCIVVNGGSSNMAFVGGGVIDGNGAVWWPNKAAWRPRLLVTNSLTGLLISNLTWVNSPNHQLELYANDAEVVDTVITAPADPTSHNTDGIDVHGSPFWIHRTTISTGDDNVAIHASDTLVEDCVFGAGHGASIGSLGGAVALSNITVRNVSFNATTQAIRIKTDEGASGYLKDVMYDSITMLDVGMSILLTMFYQNSTTPTTLKISNVTFSNIAARNSGTAGQFDCDARSPCGPIHLLNIDHTGSLGAGWTCANAHGDATNVSPTACLQP